MAQSFSGMASPADCGLVTDDPILYRARLAPDRLALFEIATGRQLTYAELDARIARCAGLLSDMLGARRDGARVAMLARNSMDAIVLAFACQRAGAIYVPLNWRLNAAELRPILADCAPALLVHDEEFSADVASLADAHPNMAAISTADGPAGLAARIEASLPAAPLPADADGPCVLLYTSGTTGQPKGVVITRRNALFAAINFSFVGEIGPETVALCDLPFFHTIGLIAVARTTLMLGGTLVVSDRFTPARTLAALADRQRAISHYFAVPQIALALRSDPAYSAAALSGLHALFVGGAPLTQVLIESYLADGVALVNGYGMSEAGTVLHVPIDRRAVQDNPGSVGLPAPLLDIRIVDEEGRDVGEGGIGELWLRGPAVTPGYWNKPLETAAAFTDGWYRTGDLGRREANGFYRIVDRLKDMYISGGENVYPAEVEAALASHPDILDVAVVGIPDARWGECGIAYVVLRPGAAATGEAIAGHCAARLAAFKRPARIFFVETIPRTASGKVQKHVLRQLHSEETFQQKA
ncbi:acyl-CoA synthetase (AMP-forming)/AMP-acid ligase II [Rhizobium leguminosarum bv. trifolii WSM2297]|uniref:3-methylmercaptopropionyl-CoA ligase n=1 Tax=Rhizobium leguminosarum bv. trifolii WSM2297 TaxID=754762 RepID=J0L3W8_RHILT|nr:AMP-binding protein [Rhizobium leguminosarum]EJC83449.1 acyl-CoA synthetase (AMP-forming)/AMP-acid ligase II [Rhizobium leguminosarum bv. trifolii WSM2297]EJC84959.1 acyl-CoA synthetase (AMP-forming)/AMP-acid ligase II [Rhizobium leguminosarum bv. trifolii WSM2297]